jgi:hypothetical protein
MHMESEERLDESFYRNLQWIAENGRYLHQNNGCWAHCWLLYPSVDTSNML